MDSLPHVSDSHLFSIATAAEVHGYLPYRSDKKKYSLETKKQENIIFSVGESSVSMIKDTEDIIIRKMGNGKNYFEVCFTSEV